MPTKNTLQTAVQVVIIGLRYYLLIFGLICNVCFADDAISTLPFFDSAFDNPKQYTTDLDSNNVTTDNIRVNWQRAKSLLLSNDLKDSKLYIGILKKSFNNMGLPSEYIHFLEGWLVHNQNKSDQAILLLSSAQKYFKQQNLYSLEFYCHFLLAKAWNNKGFYVNQTSLEESNHIEALKQLNEQISTKITAALTQMAQANFQSNILDIKKVREHTNIAINYLKNEPYRMLLAENDATMGWVYYRLDNHLESERFTRQAIELYNEINIFDGSASSYLLLAYLYMATIGHEPEVYESLQKAIHFYGQSEEKFGLAESHRELGVFLIESNQAGSLLHLKQAKQLYEALNQAEETAITNIELARLYSKQGREDDFVNSISEAKKILEQEKAWLPYLQAIHIEMAHYKDKNIAKSIQLNTQYTALAQKHGEPQNVVFGFIQGGELQQLTANMGAAATAFEQALLLNKNDMATEIEIRRQLTNVYPELNQYQLAYENLVKTSEYESKRYDKDYADRLNGMENQIQFQANQHQIESLETDQKLSEALQKQNVAEISRQRLLIKAIVIAIVPVFVIVMLLYNRKILSKQQEDLEVLVTDATEEIARQHDNIFALLNNADEGFMSCDVNLRVQGPFSAACHRILGCTPTDQLVETLLFPQHLEERQNLKVLLEKAMHTVVPSEREHILLQAPKEIELSNRNIEVDYQFIGEHHLMLVLRDVTKQKQQLAELEKASITDKLTQLYNRHKLDEILENEYDRAQRGNYEFSVVLVDIDYFKSVNDTYGHNVGDIVLRDIAQQLQKRIRKSDMVGRWGGEEFIVICVNTSIGQAVVVAEQLRANIEAYTFEQAGKVTASFGVAQYDSETIKDLFHRADKALYRAKQNGRNCVETIQSKI